MSANHFVRLRTLVRVALLGSILALNACAALTSRPADQARDCNGVLEEPYTVCNTSVG